MKCLLTPFNAIFVFCLLMCSPAINSQEDTLIMKTGIKVPVDLISISNHLNKNNKIYTIRRGGKERKIKGNLISYVILSGLPRIAKDDVDEFTKDRIIITSPYWDGVSSQEFDIISTEDAIWFSMSYLENENGGIPAFNLTIKSDKRFGCFSQYDGKMVLLLEDSSTINMIQSSKTDCGSQVYNSSIYSVQYAFDGYKDLSTQDYRSKMSNYISTIFRIKVKKIRIYGSEGYMDYQLKPDKMYVFRSHIESIENALDSELGTQPYAIPNEKPAKNADNKYDKLKKLKELLDMEAITKEEYDAEKKKILEGN